MSGTPRINSINRTQTMRKAGNFERRPSARKIPIGSENATPAIPMTSVKRIPPNCLVETGGRPRPPSSSQAARNGKATANQSQYFFLPGMFSLSTPTTARRNRRKQRFGRHLSTSGYQPYRKSMKLSLMNAQQAPSRALSIWAQQSLRSVASQTASRRTQSTTPGIIDHRIQTDRIVNTIFRGDDNRFIRTQAMGPVVRTGGGRSGCVPGAYFIAEWLLLMIVSV